MCHHHDLPHLHVYVPSPWPTSFARVCAITMTYLICTRPMTHIHDMIGWDEWDIESQHSWLTTKKFSINSELEYAKRTTFCRKKSSYCRNEAYVAAKQPYIATKETYTCGYVRDMPCLCDGTFVWVPFEKACCVSFMWWDFSMRWDFSMIYVRSLVWVSFEKACCVSYIHKWAKRLILVDAYVSCLWDLYSLMRMCNVVSFERRAVYPLFINQWRLERDLYSLMRMCHVLFMWKEVYSLMHVWHILFIW